MPTFFSRYSTAVVAGWASTDFASGTAYFYATGQDRNTILAPAGFVNAAAGDYHLAATAAGIDAGDPASIHAAEPGANGGRVNIGAYGNTAEAEQSNSPVLQVTTQNTGEKLEAGQTYTVEFRTDDLLAEEVVLSMSAANITAQAADGVTWQSGRIYRSGTANSGSFHTFQSVAVNTVAELPEAVFRDGITVPQASQDWLRYTLPVADGTYTLRLFGMSPNATAQNMTIRANGTEIATGFSFNGGVAGNYVTRATEIANVQAVNGQLMLEFRSLTPGANPILSGFELIRENPAPVLNPQFDVAVSIDNGETWTPIAGAVTLERSGIGRVQWTASPETAGATALIRVTQVGGTLTDISDQPFRISNGGRDFYVNDNSLTGDVHTTAVGNNANSGKSADAPMADLGALIRAYGLQAGDRVWIDSGNYVVPVDLILTGAHSGTALAPVEIRGAGTGLTTLTRDNIATGAETFDLRGVDHLVVSDLTIAGGNRGVMVQYNTGTTNVTFERVEIRDTRQEGIRIEGLNTGFALNDLEVHRTALSGAGYGIYTENAPTTITGGLFYDLPRAIFMQGAGNIAQGFSVVGATASSQAAVYVQNGGIVRDATVRDGAGYGVSLSTATLENSVIFGNAGFNVDSFTGTVRGNVIHGGSVGVNSYFGTIEGNRIFDNGTGILSTAFGGTTTILRNQIYGNGIGVQTDANFSSVYDIRQNLIYANTNAGVIVRTSGQVNLIGNTLYQAVGSALTVDNAAAKVFLRNNILQSDQGAIVTVTGAATVFNSNFNLYHRGTGSAVTGSWAGTTRSDLAAWRTASGEGARSIAANPAFLDINGADNVLGGVDGLLGGGADDNFNLDALSAAIDAGTAYGELLRDFFDRARSDDPTTANTGEGYDLFVETPAAGVFDTTAGLISGLSSSGNWSQQALPFTFTYYGTAYSTVRVTTEGYLVFGTVNPTFNLTQSEAFFRANPVIAPFWTDVNAGTVSGHGVHRTVAADNSWVRFRWQGVTQGLATTNALNFAVTLFADGRIAFDYGPGNQDNRATVGLSAGNGDTFVLSTLTGNTPTDGSVRNFAPEPGLVYYDIGAFEFQGDSGDVTPPVVVDIPQLPPQDGTTALAFTAFTVITSEALELVSARSPANYELRGAGADDIFDTGDDVLVALTPSYSFPETDLTLSFDAPLADGLWRLTLSGTLAIYDTAGNRLDGDANGAEGGDYVRTFTVDRTTNALPVANAATAQVTEDGSVVITLGATDADGDPLSFSVLTTPLYGVLTDFDSVAGTITYRPNANSTRTDAFRFAVDDGKLGHAEAVITINVIPVNDAPTATPATRAITGGVPTTIVLAGTDVETAPSGLRADIVTPPAVGTLVRVSDLVFEYTAPILHSGTETLVFTVRDSGDPAGTPGNALSSGQAIVTLNVTPGNTAPVIGAVGPQVVNEGDTLTVDLGALTTDAEGHALTWLILSGPDGVTIDAATGVISFAPGGTSGQYDVLVQVTDNGAGALSDQVTVAITAQNLAPVATLTAPDRALIGTTVTVTPAATDAGGDTIGSWRINWGDGTVDLVSGALTSLTHAYSLAGNRTVSLTAIDSEGAESAAVTAQVSIVTENAKPVWTSTGFLSASAGDTFTLNLADYVSDAEGDAITFSLLNGTIPGMTIDPLTGIATLAVPADTAPGSYRFALQATDALGATARRAVFLNVDNQPPEWQAIRRQEVAAGETFTLALADYTRDPDGNPLTYAILKNAQPGMTVDAATGVLTWDIDMMQAPGPYKIVLRVTDSAGAAANRTIIFDVNNYAPEWDALPRQAVSAGGTVSFALADYVSDYDKDAITYALVASGFPGATVDAATGVFTLTVPADETPGSYSFTVTATDTLGASSQRVLFVDIDNTIPEWDALARQAVSPGDTVSLALGDLVRDADGHAIVWEMTSADLPGATLDVATGQFHFAVPADLPPGSFRFAIKVSDPVGGYAARTVFVDVDNSIPEWQQVARQTASAGDTVSLNLADFVTDPDGNPINFTLRDGDLRGVTLDRATGAFTLTLRPDQDPGSYSFVVTADDGIGGFASMTFWVDVDNNLPEWLATPRVAASAGDIVTVDLGALVTDADGNAITFSFRGATVAGASIDAATGILSWAVPADQAAGLTRMVIIASDGIGGEAVRALSFDVDNAAPVWTGPTSFAVNEGQTFSIDLDTLVSDADLNPLTITVTGVPVGNATIDPATNILTWTLPQDANGVQVLRLRADDGLGQSASRALRVNVKNLPPVASLDAPAVADTGASVAVTPGATDPGNDPITEWRIDWGDGSAAQTVAGSAASLEHTYTLDGTWTVQLRAVDANGGVSAPVTATVMTQTPAAPMMMAAFRLAPAVPVAAITAAEIATVAETGARQAVFTVSLDAPATDPVAFSYAIEAGGNAVQTGEAIIARGRQTVTLRQDIDPLADWDQVTLRVFAAVGAVLPEAGFQTTTTLDIVDDGTGLAALARPMQPSAVIEWV